MKDSTVILLLVLGGAAFAVWYFFLRKGYAVVGGAGGASIQSMNKPPPPESPKEERPVHRAGPTRINNPNGSFDSPGEDRMWVATPTGGLPGTIPNTSGLKSSDARGNVTRTAPLPKAQPSQLSINGGIRVSTTSVTTQTKPLSTANTAGATFGKSQVLKSYAAPGSPGATGKSTLVPSAPTAPKGSTPRSSYRAGAVRLK